MRPIALKGHERAITFLKYSREGDLLFTCAKDNRPCVWYAETGERVGTYNGHTGTVWTLDVNWDTTRLVTGSGDNTAKLWDVESGLDLVTFPHKSPVRSVAFGEGDSLFLAVTDKVMGRQASIFIYPHARDIREQARAPLREICPEPSFGKINQALFGPLNTSIYTANEDGTVRLFDTETGKQTAVVQEHKKGVNTIAFSADQGCFITASDDATAKILDTRSLKVLKTYEAEKAVNSAAISPILPHIMLGGGQDAAEVTTTHSRTGNFQTRFFNLITQTEIASIKGHFGPIHTLAFSPDGKGFASGSEDGYVRVHHFDPSYFSLGMEDVLQAPPPAAAAARPKKDA